MLDPPFFRACEGAYVFSYISHVDSFSLLFFDLFVTNYARILLIIFATREISFKYNKYLNRKILHCENVRKEK